MSELGTTPRQNGIEERPHSSLLAELHALHGALRTEKRQRWNRDLPFNELIVDRWERARNLGFGEGSSLYDNSYVLGHVKVGANTWIGPFTMLDGSGGLTIGDWCAISAGVQIYTHDSVRWALSGGKAPHERASVTIGDCCYIGADAVVAKGVTIGHHSVVAANAFVNRDVPPFTIVGGCPSRRLGIVEIDSQGDIRLRFSSADAPRCDADPASPVAVPRAA